MGGLRRSGRSMAEMTTARVRGCALDKLHDMKRGRESVADVVDRLIAEHEADAGESDYDREQGRMGAGSP
jgi:hypothetical protein